MIEYENRMVVDSQWTPFGRIEPEEENDHIVLIKGDGTVVYEDGWEPEEDITTYCDIYDCSECPRRGDDCDGEYEDEDEE